MTRENDRQRLINVLSRSDRVHREPVLEAVGTVPRHEFVPDSHAQQAYHDRPLPIGHGQTISAPHMVAIMTDRLALSPEDRVLEIGTGCGYHAAVVAEIVDTTVYSVEYVPELAESAQQQLDRLGYDVSVTTGDGHEGLPEHAPYDAAYLTCAAPELPDPIAEQIAPGGRIVAPVGKGRQQLLIVEKHEDGSLNRTTDGYVQFVPMQG